MTRRARTLRIRLVAAALGLIALGLLYRCYLLQIVHGEDYRTQATDQYITHTSDTYDRGAIFFTSRTGELVSAAAVKAGFSVAVDPSRTKNPDKLCDAVADQLTIDQDLCYTRATLPKRTYVVLENNVDRTTANALAEIEGDSLYILPQQWRYYPGDTVSARTIGFTGHHEQDSTLRGKYGIERQYDSVLFRDEQATYVNFFAELFTELENDSGDLSAHGDIVTTLEPTVSRMLDSVLEQTHETFDSNLTGAVIMRPDTGEIVAMNSIPTFNLNDRSNATISQFRNPLVQNVYEFGSTIKALTVAAGLDSRAITPYTTYFDAGAIELDGYTIRNYDGRGRGEVDMQQVLNQSLNTGVSQVVQLMGKGRFREYFLDAFALGKETGIDLPNEAHGLVGNLQAHTDVEYATASFGQGIAVTPIAATRALATLANGGYLVTPHIGKEIRFPDGNTKTIQHAPNEKVLEAETSETISRMLTVVVDDALRNGTVALPNHTVAAKTGTAQIPNPSGGGYYDDRYLHSFFGYFPAYEPEFIIFLYTVEPKNVRYASETLTKPFMELVNFLINYYEIPPDR